MNSLRAERLRFAGFELDPANGVLRKDGAVIKLPPQPFKALTLLASRPDMLVTREELRQAIWGDTVVDFEHGLNTCIRQIRTALGEDGESPQIIETVPRLGYRFKPTVKREPAASRSAKWVMAAAGVTLVAVVTASYWKSASAQPPAAEPVRVAVLPFVSAGGEQNDETLAEGIAEDLIARLNAFDGVRVVSKTSAFSFKGKNLPLREIGSRVNVVALLAGTVRQSGKMIEIGARLVTVPGQRELWSHRYVIPVPQMFRVQGEIASSVAETLRLRPARPVRKWPTENLDAYTNFVRGRSALERLTVAGSRTAIRFFQDATALDPGYAEAQAGLAEAYGDLSFTGGSVPQDAYQEAARAVGRALALDVALPETHMAAASLKYRFEHDWSGAERESRRAIDLDPNSGIAHERYGMVLALEGRFAEALNEARLAESLDPLSPRTTWMVAVVLFYARRYDEAIDQAKRTLEIDPTYDWAYQTLAQCYEEKGKFDEAIRLYLRAGRSSGNLGHAYAMAGRTTEARHLLAELEKRYGETGLQAAGIAMVYSGLGDRDRAFKWLETAYKDRRWLGTLKVAPVWDRLRSDPRFAQLLQKAGLAELEVH